MLFQHELGINIHPTRTLLACASRYPLCCPFTLLSEGGNPEKEILCDLVSTNVARIGGVGSLAE